MVILTSNVLTEAEYQDYLRRKQKVANLLKKENYKKNSLESGMSEKKVGRHFAKSMAKFKKKNTERGKFKTHVRKIKTKERIKNMQDTSKILQLLKEKSIAGINQKYNDKDIIRYKELRAVKHKAKGFCMVCKVKKADCMHHIILLKHGGTNGQNNLLPICNTCHEKIHDWMLIKKQNEEIDRQFYEAITK